MAEAAVSYLDLWFIVLMMHHDPYHVRSLAIVDRDAWLRLRHALWPEVHEARHTFQVDGILRSPSNTAFGAFDQKQPVGFAEAGLRTDYVNGCVISPVVFLEGVFVEHAFRRQGIARILIETLETWAKGAGCSELASDTDLGSPVSQRLHESLGFVETERVVFYRKLLASAPGTTGR